MQFLCNSMKMSKEKKISKNNPFFSIIKQRIFYYLYKARHIFELELIFTLCRIIYFLDYFCISFCSSECLLIKTIKMIIKILMYFY